MKPQKFSLAPEIVLEPSSYNPYFNVLVITLSKRVVFFLWGGGGLFACLFFLTFLVPEIVGCYDLTSKAGKQTAIS